MELAQNIDGSIRTLGTPVMIHLSREQIDMKSLLFRNSITHFTMTPFARFRVQFGLYLIIFGAPLLLIIGLVNYFK